MQIEGPVAIVGGGISGLSCAHALHQAGVGVHLYERAARVGGRCATRLWQGHLVDHGVSYFTAETPEFKRELLTSLRQFRPIIPPVLDAGQNVIHTDCGPRFYVLQGNNYFAHVLSRGLDLRLNTTVETIGFQNGGIQCMGQNYRAVVSSLPAPQTAAIFALDQGGTDYRCGLTAVLEYSGANIGESAECYGRVLPPGTEPLEASYCENHKSGRILSDKTVFILQASPRFSATHADEDEKDYVPKLASTHEDLWKIPAGKRTAFFGHRWRLSFPEEKRKQPKLPPGAFICGDSCCAPTVEQVWLDGRRAASEVLQFLSR